MPEHVGQAHAMTRRGRLLWFIALESLCVLGFVVLLAMGQSRLAAAVLLGPFQLLAWLVLAGSGRALLIAFVAVVPLAGAELVPTVYQRYVLFPGTIGLLALLLFSRHVFGDLLAPTRIRMPERSAMLVLSAWTVVSGILAAFRGWGNQALPWNTLLMIEVMLLTYFAAVVPRSLQDIRVLLYVILASMTVVASWVPILPLVSGGLGGKVVSTPFGLTNLNIVACGLSIVGAVALGLATGAERVGTRSLLSVVVLLCVIALVVTRSRGAWFGFGAAFLYLLLRTRSLGLLLSGAGSGLALLASDFLRTLLSSRAAVTNAYDPSMYGRFMLWHFAWVVSRANLLFGVGMDNFRYVKHFYGYPLPWAVSRPFNAHNLYLEVLADLGIVGFAVFFWLFGSSFVHSWRAVRFRMSRDLGLGLSAGFIACAVHGMVESAMFNPGVFALLGVLLGFSISLRRLISSPSSFVLDSRETVSE